MQLRASHAYDPIAYPSSPPDYAFADGKATNAMEWIWRKAEVSCNNVKINPTHSALAYTSRAAVYRFAHASIRILEVVFPALNRRHNTLRIPFHQSRTVFLKGRRNIRLSPAVRKDAYNSFAESICLFDLPFTQRRT
jgi:hypothetical protein